MNEGGADHAFGASRGVDPPPMHPAPTRGSLRWAYEALQVCGHDAAKGVIELHSQRELARLMNLSAGTVNRYVRRLGPGIVRNTAPVVLDVDALAASRPCGRSANGTLWASRGPRPEVATPHDQNGSRTIPSSIVDDLTDSLTDLLVELLRPRLSEILSGALDELIGARTADGLDVDPTARAARATFVDKVARDGARSKDSQTDVFPNQEENPDCLTPSTVRDERAPLSTNGAQPGAHHPDVLLEAHVVRQELTPLLEACRATNKATDYDQHAVNTLRQLTLPELRHGVYQITASVRDGVRLTRPLGLLVSKVTKDRLFFTSHHTPTVVHPDEPVDEPVEDETGDPLAELSAEQLAVVEADIARVSANGRFSQAALDLMRRGLARDLLRRTP